MTTSFRKLGSSSVRPIGLGCMSLSHAYGAPPDDATGARILNRALDLGYDFLDTAVLYGFGRNETLVGNAVSHRRKQFVLASKCGILRHDDGRREVNGSPAVIRAACEGSLRRLKTDVIDLYYLHRWNRKTPIEESIGALADLVCEGKIRGIGLSEVSAATLRRAHAVHPITAIQSEYSLWTRNPEIAVLDACKELGVSFVAFSPVARGFLAGGVRDNAKLLDGDIRRNMPRFQGENFTANLKLLAAFEAEARKLNCTPGQLCLAWLLEKRSDIIPIPGTQDQEHLEENWRALNVTLDAAAMARLEALVNENTVAGARYNTATQAEIDTEDRAA